MGRTCVLTKPPPAVKKICPPTSRPITPSGAAAAASAASCVHLLTDGRGQPLSVELSAGRAHESKNLTPLLECASGYVGAAGPQRSQGDRGYSYDYLRAWLARGHMKALIPQRSDQIAQRGGQALPFDAKAYKQRNVIERCIGRLKEARRVAMRYEKLAVHYLGVLKLAMIQCQLSALSNTPSRADLPEKGE
jgi:transposase